MKTEKIDLSRISLATEEEQKILINLFVGQCGNKGLKHKRFVTSSAVEKNHYINEMNYRAIPINRTLSDVYQTKIYGDLASVLEIDPNAQQENGYVVSNLEYEEFENLGFRLERDYIGEGIINRMYEVTYRKQADFYEHAQHIHYAVIQLGRLELFKLRCKILEIDPNAEIIQYITDSILFRSELDFDLNYKKEKIPTKLWHFEPGITQEPVQEFDDWHDSSDYMLLLGPAGSGKSTMLSKDYPMYEYLACSNTAACNIGGVTIDAKLGALLDFKYSNLSRISGNFIIDEISEISPEMLCAVATLSCENPVYKCNFILSGDFKQGLTHGIDFSESPILKYICKNSRKVLNHVYRFSDQNYAQRIRNFDFPTFPHAEFKRLNI